MEHHARETSRTALLVKVQEKTSSTVNYVHPHYISPLSPGWRTATGRSDPCTRSCPSTRWRRPSRWSCTLCRSAPPTRSSRSGSPSSARRGLPGTSRSRTSQHRPATLHAPLSARVNTRRTNFLVRRSKRIAANFLPLNLNLYFRRRCRIIFWLVPLYFFVILQSVLVYIWTSLIVQSTNNKHTANWLN